MKHTTPPTPPDDVHTQRLEELRDRPGVAGPPPADGVNAVRSSVMDGHDDPEPVAIPAPPGPSRTSAVGGTT